jgi:DNA polymerase/3'-5' exonuclease PolX
LLDHRTWRRASGSTGWRLPPALRRIAALLAVEGGPAYRRRAFERGARSVERFAGDFEALVREGRLRELPSIGPVLERIVGELAASGSCKMLEDLERRLPAGAAELSSVLSLPRMRALGAALGIRSLAELEEACAKGRVRGVAGFGEKSERKLLDDVRALTERGRALLLPEADATLRHAVEYARSRPEILSAHAAGTQRRAARGQQSAVARARGARAGGRARRVRRIPSRRRGAAARAGRGSPCCWRRAVRSRCARWGRRTSASRSSSRPARRSTWPCSSPAPGRAA